MAADGESYKFNTTVEQRPLGRTLCATFSTLESSISNHIRSVSEGEVFDYPLFPYGKRATRSVATTLFLFLLWRKGSPDQQRAQQEPGGVRARSGQIIRWPWNRERPGQRVVR